MSRLNLRSLFLTNSKPNVRVLVSAAAALALMFLLLHAHGAFPAHAQGGWKYQLLLHSGERVVVQGDGCSTIVVSQVAAKIKLKCKSIDLPAAPEPVADAATLSWNLRTSEKLVIKPMGCDLRIKHATFNRVVITCGKGRHSAPGIPTPRYILTPSFPGLPNITRILLPKATTTPAYEAAQ